MPDSRRLFAPSVRSTPAALGALACLLWGTTAPAALAPNADAVRQDARLNCVCFADAANGWAVGDRGVIWHTTDGGESWKLQNSEVDANLESVHFLDRKNGWAAGGSTQPYTRLSTAVVLQTRDGGEHWYHDSKLLLPAVRRIKFFDPAHGWAVGVSSALFPSGVFTTDDGGRSWTALPAGGDQTWLAADFIDPLTGAIAGSNRAVASVSQREISEAQLAESDLGAWHGLKLDRSGEGWLVGDGGRLLRSADLGRKWQPPPGELPAGLDQQFDLCALATHGTHCWIAGAPGTRVLHTADGGRTWSIYPTAQTLPIRALEFVDSRHGWAVGELGLILATDDGGRTWRRQHGGGSHSALLAFYSELADLPLELFARLSNDEGYLGVAEILNRDDVEVRSAASSEFAALVHEATVRAGGSAAETAWNFPLRQPGLNLKVEQLADGWNRTNDGEGVERLLAHLVCKIRTWRPAVVVTSAPGGADNRAGLISQLVLTAVQRAADRQRYPDQITGAGLEPWTVQKVFGSLPIGQLGTVNLNTSQVAVQSGRSLSEVAAPARGLLPGDYAAAPPTLGFRLLVDHIPQEVGQRDFFSGISLEAGGDSRRALSAAPDDGLDRLRRAAQGRRNLQAILARADGRDQNDVRWLAEVGELTATMEEASAAEILFQMSDRYYRSGRWDMAADGFGLLVERYPKDPLASAALVWLVKYYSSSEAAWRTERQQQVTFQQLSATVPVGEAFQKALTTAQRAANQSPNQVEPAANVSRANGLVKDRRGGDERLARAEMFARLLEQSQPGLFAEPVVGFPLAAVARKQGTPRQAERFFLGMRRGRPHDAWWACAQGEQWLSDGQGRPPKAVCRCLKTDAKPKLDGKLDEPMWQQAAPLELHSAQHDDAEWPAVAMLAYDDEYLYLAVSCHDVSGVNYSESKAVRVRDADLADHDRVELFLDIDRDYTTYYRLAVDHRGWTNDGCWHDKTWNPRWFVAAQHAENSWTIEAAIPLRELCPATPARKQAWAIGIQRVVPGAGFQSWTAPAAVRVMPEGFGYLIFE